MKIGQKIDFMDASGLRYRGTVVDIRDGVPLASVLGYPFLFPLIGMTAAQAGFVIGQAAHAD